MRKYKMQKCYYHY